MTATLDTTHLATLSEEAGVAYVLSIHPDHTCPRVVWRSAVARAKHNTPEARALRTARALLQRNILRLDFHDAVAECERLYPTEDGVDCYWQIRESAEMEMEWAE